MILAAYQITLDNAGKLSFNYMNKVLENWYSKGYTTVEQVQAESEKRKAEKQQENDSSFNVDELEMLALDKYRRSDD